MQVQAEQESPAERALREIVRRSDVIFVGTVSAVGDPAKNWSGRVPAFQSVTYDVSEYVKGKGETKVTVEHVLVKQSPSAAPGDTPSLSPTLFAKAARLIVCASRGDDGRLRSLDERLGTLAFSDAQRAHIGGLLAR